MTYFKNFKVISLQFIIILVICIATVPAAYAGSDDESGFSLTIPGIRYLVLENQSIDFTPDAVQLLDGWTEEEESITRVSANVDWVLTVRGTEAFWEGPWAKPVSDIYWKYGDGEFMPLSTEPSEIASGGPSSQEPYSINLRVRLDLENDVPGDYTYTYVIYELSAP